MVPTLISSAGASNGVSHRILAALEGRTVPTALLDGQGAVRHRLLGARWVFLLLVLVAVGLAVFWIDRLGLDSVKTSTLSSSSRVGKAVASDPLAIDQTVGGGQAVDSRNGAVESLVSNETAAAIIENWVTSGRASQNEPTEGNVRNPLEQLTMMDAVGKNAALSRVRGREVKPGSEAARTTSSAKSASVRQSGRQELGQDAAVLASVLAMGLPESELAGVRITQENGVRIREVPMDQVAERLKACDSEAFFKQPTCRANICEAVRGEHPSCTDQWESTGVEP